MSSAEESKVEEPKVSASDNFNFYRDLALFWPAFFFLLYGSFNLVVGSHDERVQALRFLALGIVAIIAAKERIFLFLWVLGFYALRCLIHLVLHGWEWRVFAIFLLVAIPFGLASTVWRKPRLSYQIPGDLRMIDLIVSLISIGITLTVFYLLSL